MLSLSLSHSYTHFFHLSLFLLLSPSGSMNQFIAVYNANGDVISNIKYYDGFMGQRIGAISCLAFHPNWVKNTQMFMKLRKCLKSVFQCQCLRFFFFLLKSMSTFDETNSAVKESLDTREPGYARVGSRHRFQKVPSLPLAPELANSLAWVLRS